MCNAILSHHAGTVTATAALRHTITTGNSGELKAICTHTAIHFHYSSQQIA